MDNPVISIIIPTYNRSNSLKKAINSVLCQSFRDFELIVVDDCSNDDTVAVVNSYTDKRIRLLQLPINSGPAKARNAGIKASNGAYISFLDSDDEFTVDFLKKSHGLLKDSKSNIGFSWTGVRYVVNNQSKEFIWHPKWKESSYATLLHELRVGIGCGITVKKKVFNFCGLFDDTLPAAEDTEFFLRISKQFDYLVVPEVLIVINKGHVGRLSRDFSKIGKAYNTFMPVHLPIISKSNQLKKKYYYKLIWLNYYIPDKKMARYYFKALLLTGLFPIKAILIWLIFEIFPLEISARIHQRQL